MKIKLYWIPVLLVSLSLQSCYLVKQGIGQFKLRFEQVPLQEAIAVEQNKQYKKLIAAVPAIKQYATETLKLKKTANYTGYYATDEEGVAFVVTASPKTRLEAYTWWFPVVGSVPYKGYFNKADAQALEQELIAKGFDTWVFAAPAYSTLGWFKDPITTPMLRKGYFALASTLIHEMVHTTIYVKGEGDFNEQLASFVEDKGAMGYFQERGLLSQHQVALIQAAKNRKKRLKALLQNRSDQLEGLYESGEEEAQILQKREQIFATLSEEVADIYPEKSEKFGKFNNARLLQYNRYQEDSTWLKQIWQKSDENWARFWQLVADYVKTKGWES